MNDGLEPAERVAAAQGFADLHSWAAVAWRSVCAGSRPAQRASVLADVAEMASRLEEIRVQLDIPELPSANGQSTGTGWV